MLFKELFADLSHFQLLKLARAVYYMLKRKVAFDKKRFLND